MKIVVLMGGDSTEREVSLVTGDKVAKALEENGHQVIKIDPIATKDEQTKLNQSDRHWIGIDYPDIEMLPLHRGSMYLKNLLIIKRLKPDLVFNALHGGKGENGVVQGMLDAAEILYTGSGRIACLLAMEKEISKIYFKSAKLPTPKAIVLERPEASRKKLKKVDFPQVVKPNNQGSTIGLKIVRNYPEMEEAIDEAFNFSPKVIVEEYIPGREITVGIIKNRTFPVVEIIPKHGVYDYECKYSKGMSRYEVPAQLDEETARLVQKIALKAHSILGCQGYSRVDMRLSPEGEPYVLEVNTLPGLTDTSLLPMACRKAGINYNAMIEMIVEEAINKPKLPVS
ncbi:MAG: D-alanine--D-alanine ligase [Calditrichaeota bacterium]|nr:D-alanine--D-alanine ligase [Calditrichota bacterium]